MRLWVVTVVGVGTGLYHCCCRSSCTPAGALVFFGKIEGEAHGLSQREQFP